MDIYYHVKFQLSIISGSKVRWAEMLENDPQKVRFAALTAIMENLQTP